MLNAEKILAFLAENYHVDKEAFGVDDPLFSSGSLDSFAMMELITFIEDQAKVAIRAKEVTLDNFDSVSRILRLLESKSVKQ